MCLKGGENISMNNDLTPASIPTMSFSEKANAYEETLKKRADKEAEILQTELLIRELFTAYDIAVRFRGVDDLTGLEEKLTIYMPVGEKDHVGLVYTCAKNEGRAFSDIASNPPLLKKLGTKFGVRFVEFVREVDDVFNMRANQEKQEEDEDRTIKIKSEYTALSLRLSQSKIDLRKIDMELKSIEKYVDFCKSVLALAQSGKSGNQNPQKPQGQ